MSRALTVTQWRKVSPAYDRAYRTVTHLAANWPGWTVPRLIAHINPDTRTVSIVLDGDVQQRELAEKALTTGHGYQPGGWRWDTDYPVAVWRKDVTR